MMEFTVVVMGTAEGRGPSLLGVVRGQAFQKDRQQVRVSE